MLDSLRFQFPPVVRDVIHSAPKCGKLRKLGETTCGCHHNRSRCFKKRLVNFTFTQKVFEKESVRKCKPRTSVENKTSYFWYSSCDPKMSMTRQPERKSSSESSESVVLSVECCKSGSRKLIGQFCRDVIGCRTQVAFVSSDWSVSMTTDESITKYMKFVLYRINNNVRSDSCKMKIFTFQKICAKD